MSIRTTIIAGMVFLMTGCGRFLADVGDVPPEKADSGVADVAHSRSTVEVTTDASAGSDGSIGGQAPMIGRPDGDGPPYVFEPSPKPPTFVDNFSRPDGPIGNGWFEKTQGSFVISGGEAVQLYGGYIDMITLRTEVERDVEVSGTTRLRMSCCYTRLFARVLPSTDVKGQIEGYVVTLGATFLAVGKERRLTTSTIDRTYGTILFNSSLLTDRFYRIAFRVSGDDQVALEAAVYEEGSSVPIASVRGEDTSPERIVGAGRVGFAAEINDSIWRGFSKTIL